MTVAFAQALKARKCSFIDVSTGGLTPSQEIPVGPGYQVPFARGGQGGDGLPTIAVGLITERGRRRRSSPRGRPT